MTLPSETYWSQLAWALSILQCEFMPQAASGPILDRQAAWLLEVGFLSPMLRA